MNIVTSQTHTASWFLIRIGPSLITLMLRVHIIEIFWHFSMSENFDRKHINMYYPKCLGSIIRHILPANKHPNAPKGIKNWKPHHNFAHPDKYTW